MLIKSGDSYNSYHGIRVAVFGASGFIGRWVARALCAQGANVCLVVRNRALAKDIFSQYSIHGFVFEGDLRDRNVVGSLLHTIKPSIVFNLAGSVDRSKHEKTAYQINVDLIAAICETVVDIHDPEWLGQNIVHVGSSFEYGKIGGDLSEDSIPNPTTLYGKSKLAGTTLLSYLCKAGGIKGLTARLFTIYGPGERHGRLLLSLCKAARTKRPLRLTDGLQRKDFIYVEDVADGLLRLGLATANPGEIVNLARGKLTSVRTFAETAAKILRIPLERLRFGAVPQRIEEMEHAEVTVERLKQLTGWVPVTGTAEGIRKTVDFENAHCN